MSQLLSGAGGGSGFKTILTTILARAHEKVVALVFFGAPLVLKNAGTTRSNGADKTTTTLTGAN